MRVPRNARPEAAGFTLIEIVIVLTMIGIVAALAIPKIDIPRYQIEGAMHGVGTTMLAAQRLAVSRQHDVAVRFDLPGQALLLHEDANDNQIVDAGERVRRLPLGERVVFGRGSAAPEPSLGTAGAVTFAHTAQGMPVVTFHRNGSASESGGFYLTSLRALTLPQYTSDARAVEIERATGRATWYRYTGRVWIRAF